MTRQRTKIKETKSRPPSGAIFKTPPHTGIWISLTVGAALLTIAVLLALWLLKQPISALVFWMGLAAFVALIGGVIFVYRAGALFSLRYTLTRNGLDIRWGWLAHRIPIGDISAMTIVPADALSRRWMGIFPVPNGWVGQQGDAHYYAPSPEDKIVRVDIDAAKIFVSPKDAEVFIEAWQSRVPLGATQHWHHKTIRRGWLRHPIWVDTLARRLVLGAIALTLILVGGVFTQYPTLPEKISLSMGALGQPAALVAREQLLWLPAGGAIVLLFNLLLGAIYYGKNKFAAYMLWFLAAVVQIGLWVGARLVIG